jgi:hypothetical protein
MFRQVGGALGVAAFVAIVGTPARDAAIVAYRHGWYFMIVAAAIGSLFMLAARFAPRPAPAPAPQPQPARATV